MNSFSLPFFKNFVRISHTDVGVVEIIFENKQSQSEKIVDSASLKIKRELTDYLAGRSDKIDIPVDWKNLRGTDFQKRVWKKMSKIPYGKVKSYGELAKSLQSPGAARAVGTACAKNPVLLAIPCHRVVGASGLGGFSGGGLGVKRQLLDLEQLKG